MRCGRPAICTGVGGIPELLEDGKTGFLVPAPTITHVDEALERAWQNRQKLQSMGEAASKAVAVKLPADPIKTFADELIHLAASIKSKSRFSYIFSGKTQQLYENPPN